MDVRVYLAGRIALTVDGDEIIRERDFRARQERLAFAYLVLARARPVARDELADALWGDEAPPAWPAAVSAIVSRLRAVLAHQRLPALQASISGRFGQYQLHLPAGAWVDVEAAVAALGTAEGAIRAGTPARAFGPAWAAATIAERPFVSGVDGGWAALERSRLARLRVRALECLAKAWLASGDTALAGEAANEALRVDPLRESSYRLLMEAQAVGGNPARALKTYHDLRELLVSQLGTDPSQEIEALYLQLLR